MKTTYFKFKNKKPSNGERERLLDLVARLKKYDTVSKKYKIDFYSILPAIQMVLRVFPQKYCNSHNLIEKSLRAFVTTIIPGADLNEENLVKMYYDKYYPFSTYCGYFVFDLNKRSKRLFEEKEFYNLTLNQRTEVIQNALSGKELASRLYKGAILMAQVSYFGAIYNEERGCQLIDFPGNNEGYSKEEQTYSFSSLYFDRELSLNGQPW